MLLTKLTAQDAQNTPGREPQARLHTVRLSVAPHRIIYGEVLTGGTLVYATSTGTENRVLHLVIVLAAHEVESIGSVYLGDYLSTDARFQRTQKQVSNVDFSFNVENSAASSFAGTGTVIANGITFNQAQTINFASINADINALRDGLYAQIIAHAGYAAAPYIATTGGISMGANARDLGRIIFTAKVAGTGFTYSASAAYAENAVTVAAADGQPNGNASFVYVGKHLGSNTQAADATMIALIPQWNSARQLKGRAYIYVQMVWDQDVFPTGIPDIKAMVKGKKLYDPRTATTYWSDNWALCARDYLSSNYGMQCTAGEIDDATVITAANIADELVATTGAATQKRYRCNGSFTLDMAPKNIIEAIEKTACGLITPVGGVYRIYAGAYTSPTVTLTDSDLRGPMKVRPTLPIDQVYNAVRGTYVDPVGGWQQTDFPPQKNATYAAEDGGEIFRDLELSMTTDGYQSQRVAKIFLERSRQAITVDYPANLKQAFGLALWDTVRKTNSLLGWTNKEFKVIKWSFKDGGVDLLLQEEASASYNWNNGLATVIDPAPNTNLPNPFFCPPPTNLVLDSGDSQLLRAGDGAVVSRVFASWTVPANSFIIEYEFSYRRSSVATWESYATQDAQAFINPALDGAHYDIRVRARNITGTASAWLEQLKYFVVGKTAPPSPVSTFLVSTQADGTRQFTWAMNNPPLDLAGYQIRYKSGTGGIWASMLSLHDDLLVSSPYETNLLSKGNYDFAIKSVDTTGNESVDALYINLTIPDPRLAGALDVIDAYGSGWPGVKTSCHVEKESGYLKANDSTTWSTLPVTWTAWTRWCFNPISPIVYEHTTDVGAVAPFTPLVSVIADGTATITESHSNDNISYTAYVATGVMITCRYIKIRISLAGAYPVLKSAVAILDAKIITEEITDLNTASLTGANRIAVGDIRLPRTKTYATIRRVQVALQSVGAGWTWVLIDKDTVVGPRIKIYNAAGALADATIDASIGGL